MRWLLLALLVLLFAAQAPQPALRLSMEGRTIQFEPATVRLRIRVEPDARNRALTIALVSGGFETSSFESLDGAKAPITRWKLFRDVPAGEYEAIASLYRPEEPAPVERVAFTVLGRP